MSDEETPRQPEQWHLDKRIPIALIVTILIGYSGGVLWVSNISHAVDSQAKEINRIEIEAERNISRIEAEVDQRAIQSTDAANRIIRIEEKLVNQSEILQDIKNAVSGLRATPKELQLR